MTGTFFVFFFYFRFICLILCCGLLIGIIYYFWKLRLFATIREKWQNWWGIVPVFSLSGKSRKEWQKIDKLLREPYQSSWKLAVIKAEAIVKKTLNLIGYSYPDSAPQVGDNEVLHQLHQIGEKIIKDKNFSLEQSRAKEIVLIYRKFWDELLNSL